MQKSADATVTHKPRLLVAESHHLFRQFIASKLSSRYELISVCQNGADAISSALRLNPDLILLDVLLPVVDGIQATREIVSLNDGAKVVILTGIEDPQFVSAAFSAGARGYVFKSRVATDLLKILEACLRGEAFLCSSSLRKLPT